MFVVRAAIQKPQHLLAMLPSSRDVFGLKAIKCELLRFFLQFAARCTWHKPLPRSYNAVTPEGGELSNSLHNHLAPVGNWVCVCQPSAGAASLLRGVVL